MATDHEDSRGDARPSRSASRNGPGQCLPLVARSAFRRMLSPLPPRRSLLLLIALSAVAAPDVSLAQITPLAPAPLPEGLNPDEMLRPGGLTPTLKLMGLLTLLTLAPSILMMTTCFVRFVVVFGLLRQAFGTQQLPPSQVMIALSLFLTAGVMAPVWQQAYEQGIEPYTSGVYASEADQKAALAEAAERGLRPVRRFMAAQIESCGNGSAVDLFLRYRGTPEGDWPQYYEDVPLTVLMPAFLMSELKVAFVIGFQIYLPFVVLDMVVSSVLISMGMMMLPPPLISLPFKLLLFVLIDGWTLTVEMLLRSIA